MKQVSSLNRGNSHDGLRVIQTIASTRLDHGGTSRSVPALCDALVAIGIDNHLVTALPADRSIESGFPNDRNRVHLAEESLQVRQWGVGKQFCSLLTQLRSNRAQVIIHDHAVWLPSNHAIAAYCRKNRLKRVVSPRGMLGQWALGNGRWKKRLAWYLYQQRDLKSASAFHATSEQEADEIRALKLTQPIAVVPNGLTIPDPLPNRRLANTKLTALFLSRIHPKKGLLMLIEAWHRANVGANWRLLIAGPDEGGHQAEVAAAVKHFGLQEQVKFAGPINDDAKWQLYRDADLFILPSFNENFGIVIAEAMAAGLPVITTTSTPWQVLEEQVLGWWVKPQLEHVTLAIAQAISTQKSELVERGRRASDYVRSEYSWEQAGRQLAEFYQQLMHR